MNVARAGGVLLKEKVHFTSNFHKIWFFSSNYKIRYLASSKLSKPDNFPPEWYEVDVAAILTIIFVFFIGATLEVRK